MPTARHTCRSSMTSSRRSPDSYLLTNDQRPAELDGQIHLPDARGPPLVAEQFDHHSVVIAVGGPGHPSK